MDEKGLGRSLFSFSDDFAKQGPRKIGNEGGGGIFVYSDSVSLISFEIDCYTVCESEYMKMLSPPQLPTFSGPCKTCCSCPHSNRFFSCISVISLCSLLEVNNYNLSATGYFQNRLLRLRSDFNGKQP